MEILQGLVGEIYDKGFLLGCAVALALTLHAGKASNEELQFNPVFSQFNGENVGLTA